MPQPKYLARAARKDSKNNFMDTIGAAFPFKKGDGLVVKLNLLPAAWDGEFILVVPPEKEEGSSEQ